MTTKKKAKKKTDPKRVSRHGQAVLRPAAGRRTPGRKKNRRQEDPKIKLTDHLGELRSRFISILLLITAASIGVFFYRDPLVNFLGAPAGKLIFTAPAEAFFTFIKLSVLGGLVLSLPWVLLQAYAFIAPATERKNRGWLAGGMLTCLLLFYIGAGFALSLLKPAMQFFLSFSGETLEAAIKMNEYFSFVITLVLGCGLIFEMPVLVWVLAKIGLVNSYMLASRWREALIAILLISAFVTPADVFTMIALAIPMSLLYLLSIYVAKLANH